MAPNCSEEQFPYRKMPQKIGIHHIWWGEPLEFQLTPKKIVDMKVEGLPPTNVVDTNFFWYFSIRGLLFWTIWCHLFWNRRKIERLTKFQKKSSVPPLFADIFHFTTIFWGYGIFFEILSIVKFFSDFKTDGSKLFGRAIPLYTDTKTIWYPPY